MAVSGLDYDTWYTWYVDVNDGNNAASYEFEFKTYFAPILDPFASGWGYRKQIVIDHTKVTADLTSFPILIDVTDSDLAAKAQADGNDILFVDGAGIANRLYHEIEDFNSTSGRLVAWINVPNLSSSIDTTFYIYYGNPSASDQQSPELVWDSNYVLVQHLNEAAGTHYDSTSYYNDGTPQSGVIQDTNGIIDGADAFDGVDDHVIVNDDSSLRLADHFIEVWMKRSESSTDELILVEKRGSSTHSNYFISTNKNSNQEIFAGFSDGALWYSLASDSGVIGDTDWHYIVYTVNGYFSHQSKSLSGPQSPCLSNGRHPSESTT